MTTVTIATDTPEQYMNISIVNNIRIVTCILLILHPVTHYIWFISRDLHSHLFGLVSALSQ
jgi:hypothetical protein